MLQFAASVDLTEHTIPPGIAPAIAVERAREAVGKLTGAGWVSVEWFSVTPAEAVAAVRAAAAVPKPIPLEWRPAVVLDGALPLFAYRR